MTQQTYREATAEDIGQRPICQVGYVDCPEYGPNHYHCARCGGVTGMMGHYSKLEGQDDWQFNCPTQESDAKDSAIPGNRPEDEVWDAIADYFLAYRALNLLDDDDIQKIILVYNAGVMQDIEKAMEQDE